MSRSIAAVSSCWPNASARRRASRASASPSSRRPACTCATARPYQYRGASASCGSRSCSNSAMASSKRRARQQHSREVVAREPELRVRRHGLTILLQRLVRFPLALEQLAQIVARLRVQRIGRHRQTIGGRGLAPPLLRAEQHAVVVVGLVRVVTEGEHGLVVLLGLRPLPHAAVERDQIGVGLRERWIACERGFVRFDSARDIAGLGQTQAAKQLGPWVVANGRHACGERVVDGWPSCAGRAMLLERGTSFVAAIRARAATARGRSRPRQTAGRARWRARNG